ncbi:MAG: hypothetical protein IKU52_08265 [Clostridia bacterium]|nr:hypothetical protein [Clostridia bacterium]
MEFDSKKLDEMKNMDPAELNAKIDEVCRALGVDSRMVKKLAGNPEKLKNKLEKISPDELQKISSGLDAKKLAQFKERF